MSNKIRMPVQPVVSVVMPTQASRTHLRSLALDCLLTQVDAPLFELVLVMDKGVSPTPAQAQAILDAKIPWQIVRGNFTGLTDKHNAGCHAAKGKWITFWDDDDWSASNRLSASFFAASMTEADFVGQRVMHLHSLVGERLTVRFEMPARAGVIDKTLLFKRSLWTATPFEPYRRYIDKREVGNVGTWITRRLAANDHEYDTTFTAGYVAMIHRDNLVAPPLLTDPASGRLLHNAEYTLVGDSAAVERFMGTSIDPWRVAAMLDKHPPLR